MPTAAPDPAIKQQLQYLEHLILTQGGRPIEPQKPIDLEIEVKASQGDANNNATYNFMIASAQMVTGNCDSLPPEIIDYGIRTGKIKARTSSAGPKRMDVPTELPPPDFEGLDLSLNTS